MSKASTIKVQAVHRYNVSPERVYEAFLDPERAAKFMFATFTGKMIKAEIDPKVGGAFAFIDRRPTGDAEHYGEYVTLQRPNQIAFRFAVQKDAKESDLVTIDIAALKQGCEVILTHEVKVEFANLKEQVQEGWDSILDGLGAALRTR